VKVYQLILNNPKNSTEEKVYLIWMLWITPEFMKCKNNSSHILIYGTQSMNGINSKRIG
jgi:hypothetical protein